MKQAFRSFRQQGSLVRGFLTAALFAMAFGGTSLRAHAGDNVLGFGAAGQRVTTTGKITTVNFTAEAWFKQTNSLPENQLFSQYAGGAGRFIVAVKDGKAGMFIGGTWITGTVAIPFDTWTHIAVTRNSTTWTIYIDGALYKTATGNANVLDNTGFMIGNITSSGPGFRGLISDVRVWNSVRTQPQISSSRNVRLSGSEAGLIHYWRLNEGAGSTVTDSVAAANGTISGASWSSSSDLPLVSGIPEGSWIAPSGGNWSDSANWLNAAVAQGVNGSAYFTNTLSSPITVTNDMAGLLLGQLYVNNSAAHTFTGNGVTLTNAVTSARVLSTNGTHALDVPITTTANGVSFETQTPAALTFQQIISGPGSVAVNPAASGGGTVTFSCATNTYTGPTALGCGTVAIGALPNGGQPSPIGAASAAPANLLLGPGTLRYTGPAVTTDRGYTVQAGSSRAAVLDTAADMAFGGQILATSGAFVKTGTGTLSFTSPAGTSTSATKAIPMPS